MCGLAGAWSGHVAPQDSLEAMGERMAGRIASRGPDDQGVWAEPGHGLVLAHRRLAVVDLSPAGQQPMRSACGRYVLVYNGEIYNHLELRTRLQAEGRAPHWRGHADTETLLACIAAWGVESALVAAAGMFALALWDRRDHSLTLARDRMGEKPLYYGWQAGSVLFGSELKALMAHPCFRGDIDRGALTLLLRHNCIPAPYSIYTGIRKLMPGSLVRIQSPGQAPGTVVEKAYWTLDGAIAAGRHDPFEGTDAEASQALEARLSRTVGEQMLADVPLGAFLSGGVDSSLVVAMMQRHSPRPVRTFTIGMGEGNYDEAAHARAVAAHLGTDHTELVIGPADARDLIPALADVYCEPFSDSSQIPTFLVSRLARRHVTVALSGDGGDESFGGYNRYLAAQGTWSRVGRLPPVVRRGLAAMLRSRSPGQWDRAAQVLMPLLPMRYRLALLGDKAHKLADVLLADSGSAFYRGLTSHWSDPGSLVIGGHEPPTLATRPAAWPDVQPLANWMMAMDSRTYLPDDILVKVDRAAMANSLETRVPLIDHRLVELAWRMPMKMKIRHGQGKWLLRQVLHRHVPRSLIERPKMGFGIPLDAWLRGPLREWADALLDKSLLEHQGFLHPTPIRELWDQHQSGRSSHPHHLWTILMFQSWLQRYGSPAPAVAE